MNFNEYQQKANRTLAGNEHVLTNLSLGLASESGEAIDLIKKYTFQGQDLDKVKLQLELGDGGIFLKLHCGLTLTLMMLPLVILRHWQNAIRNPKSELSTIQNIFKRS